MKKIIITGGEGRFAKTLKKNFIGKNIYYLSKKEFNILNFKSMENMIKKIKPKIIIHLAALSSPTSVHNDNISKSIDINIIGTCNLVKICEKFNIKLIHMSTHYVYPGKKGNYLETDSLLPGNNYSWSKLGGECAVQMYLKNSLIIRVAMYEVPFIHKYAFINRKSNFLTHEEVAKIIPKLLNVKGIINIGGKRCSIYKFALKTNKKVLPKKYIASENVVELMPDTSVNINKLKSILKE
jgi:dTDP-4-dehydrorhamnose reductase